MKLIIPSAIERKLNAYVQEVDGEVAGMGKVSVRDDGNIWVEDIAIYDQEVTGGTADLSPQALAFFQTDLVKKGESPKAWVLWWHSHNTFGAFFSQTDTTTIQQSTEYDHIVSLVVNKKRERKCRLDTHRPFRLVFDNIAVEVLPEVNPRIQEIDEQIMALMEEAQKIRDEVPGGIEAIKAEIAEKVKYKHRTLAGFRQNNHGNKQHNRQKDLQGPIDPTWSKKRKKGGSVTTAREVIEAGYGKDELLLLIDEAERLLKAHEANGNADIPEAEELRADIEQYYSMLIDLQAADYFGDGGFEREQVRETYWDAEQQVFIPIVSFDEYEETDQLGMPLLPSPYHGRDD